MQSKYSLPNTKQVQDELKAYLKNNNISVLTSNTLIKMLFYLNSKKLIKENETTYRIYTTDPFSERPNSGLLMSSYGRTMFIILMSELIYVLNNIGYTEFDFTDMDNINLNFILSTPELRKVKNTFKGNFMLKSPIESELQKSCGKTILQGTLTIDNGFRSKQIELPSTLTAGPIKTFAFNKNVEEYADVESYRNRSERLKRLAVNKLVREVTKKANESGILTFTDTYGVPLEIGCTVAYSNNGYITLATVLKQTTRNITIKTFNTDREVNASSVEIIRMN